MNKLWKFKLDYGSMGTIDSIFIATDEEINSIMGKEIWFGEVLGKHSEIFAVMEIGQFKEISDSQDLISELECLFGSKTLSGHNPLNYD